MSKMRAMAAVLVAMLASWSAMGMSIVTKPERPAVAAAVPGTDAVVPLADPVLAQRPKLQQDDYFKYLAAVLEAEAKPDPLARCLAYPELPGNDWPKGMAEALCALVPPEGSLDELEKMLKQAGGGAELDRRYAALLAQLLVHP